MNKVYAVGVMTLKDDVCNAIKSQRLWHFFAHFEDAEKCVLENQTNIFEYTYNLALIEEHFVYDPNDSEPGNIVAPQWWYQAIYPNNGIDVVPQIKKIEQPECFKQLCNFWAG
jgi:hypothetical protein